MKRNYFFNRLSIHKNKLFIIAFFINYALLCLSNILIAGTFGGNQEGSDVYGKVETLPVAKLYQTQYNYYDPGYLRYHDHVYKSNIRTVQLNQKGWDFSPALIEFESDEKLVLRFDDLDADHKTYYYTIIHCDAKWRPSGLRPNEYIEGFHDARIEEYRHSFNTQVQFTHYKLEFPNINMRPRIPGNYVLKVFEDNDRDDVVLTKKFMIYEQEVTISGKAHQATLVSFRDIKQEISFSINTNQYRIEDPRRDLTVVIRQNGRWDNVIHDLEPKSISGNMLDYDYDSEVLFNGVHEFRYFDTKSLKQATARIKEIVSQYDYREVNLVKDIPRSGRRYTFGHDINGRFYIQNEHGYDQYLESDYAEVNFFLSMPAPIPNGDIYLYGELTDWSFRESARMRYNYNREGYQASILLKQGYYNYMYAFLEDGESQADLPVIEGSHSDTENEYTILLYHRQPGTLFDRLIGVKQLKTHAGEQ